MKTIAKAGWKDGFRLCNVRQTNAPAMSWEFDIKDYDSFESFIRKIAEAWAIASNEQSGLHITVHTEDLTDL